MKAARLLPVVLCVLCCLPVGVQAAPADLSFVGTPTFADTAEPGGTLTMTSFSMTWSAPDPSGPFHVGVYWTKTPEDPFSWVLLVEQPAPSMDNGETVFVPTMDLPLPGDIAQGIVYFELRIDSHDVLFESDEFNNTHRESAEVGQTGYDITVGEPAGISHEWLFAGETLEFTDVPVENIGHDTTDLFSVYVYLSVNDTLDVKDRLLSGTGSMTLAPGQLRLLHLLATVPEETMPGPYNIFIYASHGPGDWNPSNNRWMMPLLVGGPDLAFEEDPFVDPHRTILGQEYTVSLPLTNRGHADATGFDVVLHGGIGGGDEVLHRWTVEETLAPGASLVLQTTPIASPAESYPLWIVIDEGNALVEENEEDNRWDDPMPLVVLDVAELILGTMPEVSPRTVVAGQTITVDGLGIFNVGSQDAPGFWVGFYLSRDLTINDDDVGVIWQRVPGVLAGEEYVMGLVEVVVPADLVGGSWYLGCWIDSGDEVYEFLENNNAIRFEVTVPTLVSALGAEPVDEGLRVSWDILDDGGRTGVDLLRRVDGGAPLRLNEVPLPATVGSHAFTDRLEGVAEGSSLVYELSDGQTVLAASEPVIARPPARPNRLDPNVPNPFNPSTRIAFSLRAGGPATLRIYDVAGRRVRTLLDEPLAAGPHERSWDGLDDAGKAVASGTYFYRLRCLRYDETRKMTLVR